jgi:hypothetical protein
MRQAPTNARGERDAHLEALLLEGLRSPRHSLDAEFHQRLEAKVEQILDKYRARPRNGSSRKWRDGRLARVR